MTLFCDKITYNKERINNKMFNKTAIKTIKFRDGNAAKGFNNPSHHDIRRPRDYIWIIPDFLQKFGKEDYMSKKAKLSLNTVHYHQTSYNVKHLPPMFAERLRAFEEKATRKTDCKAKNSYRINRLSDFHLNLRGCSNCKGLHLKENES